MKIFKNLDIFGIYYIIPIKDKAKYNTYLGTFFTILLLILAILCFLYFGRNMIYKKNVKILEKIVTSQLKDKNLNFKKDEIFFSIGIYSESLLNYIIDENILISIGKMYTFNSFNGTQSLKIQEFKLKPCNKDLIPKNKVSQEYFKNKNIERHFCLTDEQKDLINLTGIYDNNLYKSFEIEFFRCKNKTRNNNTNNVNVSSCASEDTINYLLNDVWMEFYFIEKYVDVTNLNEPVQYKKNFFDHYFQGTAQKKRVLIKYAKTELNTDEGFLFESNKKTHFFSIFLKKDENFKLKENGMFASVHISFNDNKKIIKREYDKLLKVLAEVGGLLNILFLSFKIVFYPFIKVLLFSEIIKNHYFISEKEKSKLLNKQKIDFSIKKVNAKRNSADESIRIKKKTIFNTFTTKFFKLFSYFYFECKPKETNDIFQNFALNDFLKNMEITNILRKLNEIDVLKKILFDKYELELFNSIPIILKIPKNSIENNKDSFSEAYSKIQNKSLKNKIDEKLLCFFKK